MALVAFCFSCAFLILEIIMPDVIYLNLAIASFVTGGVMLFTANPVVIISALAVSLIGSFAIIRPRIISYAKKRKMQDDIKSKYLGQIAQVVEKTDSNSGVLTINNERWQARTSNNEVIEQGESAKITNYKDIVMYVEKV